MGPLINFLVLMVFLFVGLAQNRTIPQAVGYGIGVPIAVVTVILAFLRMRQRKGSGE